MPSPEHYENWKWPYAHALGWMADARERCATTGQVSLGVGSHDKPIITLGRHAGADEIKDPDYLREQQVDVIPVDRGGGATFHGPGQIVLYPVVNLQTLGMTVPVLTALLEQVIIETLADFGITGERITNDPGVFVRGAKIGSIGLRISQSIVTHGLSLNVNNTLEYYEKFRPCRKDDASVTSMALELAHANVDLRTVALSCAKKTNTAIREGWRYSET